MALGLKRGLKLSSFEADGVLTNQVLNESASFHRLFGLCSKSPAISYLTAGVAGVSSSCR